MARLARGVIPGHPRRVSQWGNHRERTFFEEGDYALNRDLLSESSARARTSVRAYCLMSNRVHIILVPTDEDVECWFTVAVTVGHVDRTPFWAGPGGQA